MKVFVHSTVYVCAAEVVVDEGEGEGEVEGARGEAMAYVSLYVLKRAWPSKK